MTLKTAIRFFAGNISIVLGTFSHTAPVTPRAGSGQVHVAGLSMRIACGSLLVTAGLLASTARAVPVVEAPGYTVDLLASGFGAATGMTLSPSGDLYVTDDAGGRVLRVPHPLSGGLPTPEVVATGIAFPNDLTFAFGGRLLVTNPTGTNSQIVEVLSDGSTQVFASGFSFPVGITTFANHVYVGVAGDGTISQMDSSGASSTFLSGFGGPHGPFGLSFDAAGNLYFVVHGTGSVYEASQSGVTQLIGSVSPLGGVFTAATQNGHDVFVSDVLLGNLYLLDDGGVHLFASGFVGKVNPPFNGPNDVVISPSGTLYVADADKVWRISRIRGVPEPSTLALLAVCLLGLLRLRLSPDTSAIANRRG